MISLNKFPWAQHYCSTKNERPETCCIILWVPFCKCLKTHTVAFSGNIAGFFFSVSSESLKLISLAQSQREVIKYAISDITHSIWQQFETSKSHTGMTSAIISQANDISPFLKDSTIWATFSIVTFRIYYKNGLRWLSGRKNPLLEWV